MALAGVRRQLEEARSAMVESAEHATAGVYDPAYRLALKSRNLLFHATRGVAAARGEEMPEMPVVAGRPGTLADHLLALAAIDGALQSLDELPLLAERLTLTRTPYAGYLGWLREEVGKLLRDPQPS